MRPREIDDPHRLEALYQYEILDTPREEPFDALVLLAAEICQTPIAVVSLIDKDRQWFKAESGLGLRQTPLCLSICAEALKGEVFALPDITLDGRTAEAPWIPGQSSLRFCAGAPLRTGDGSVIGALCVLDHVVRDLTDRQLSALNLLADQVMAQLELRRTRMVSDRRLIQRHVVESNAQAALQEKDDLLRQKDILFREVNHRIKNSLQLVSSLLALQGRTAKNAEVRAHLAAAGLRVAAIGRAHQRLYQTGEFSEIDLGGYLRRLCQDIAESFAADGQKPALLVEATEFSMPTDHAISIGLIVSELITNAARHAYDDKIGVIEVRLQALGDDVLVLSIQDDGKGLPDNFDPAKSTGLGMKILAALVKGLHSDLEFGAPAGGRGARFSLTISKKNLAANPVDQPS